MVICCVPKCGTDSWKCDTSITFHDFPSSPDLAARWIKQINSAIKMRPMWFPRGRPVICSKHFLHTDFRGDTDALKPRCVPTVFGHKYYGQNPEPHDFAKVNIPKKPPLIVKVIKPEEPDVGCEIAQTSGLQTDMNISIGNNINCKNGAASGNLVHNNYQTLYNSTSWNANHSQSNLLLHKENSSRNNGVNLNVSKPKAINHRNIPKKNLKKKDIINSDLIEIGPNTFLKINPDIIKVNKKMTPSGNTVLQFLMDQKFAKTHGTDVLPKLIQGVTSSSNENAHGDVIAIETSDENSNRKDEAIDSKKESVVHHVLGHLVDDHKCEESCVDLREIVDETIDIDDSDVNSENKKKVTNSETSTGKEIEPSNSMSDNNNKPQEKNDDSAFIEKAPVLFKTSMPLSHCFIDKPKYLLQLKQKNRQIASLKFKVSNLNKKIEELEDRCIVQERQLSYSFIKRLKTIRKNATKGDPSATYILEQIRSYSNNSKMRWSDSTLTQCAMWCRKAPYAYEYFKKAEFFKLPCLGTVKRYMKKHPELKFQKKTTKCGPQEENEDESSSDFDFDESDGQNDPNALSEDERDNESAPCRTALSVSELPYPSDQTENATDISKRHCNESEKPTDGESEPKSNFQNNAEEQESLNSEKDRDKNAEPSECIETNSIPITLDGTNLELQEIILPSGEVVQCYSSNITNNSDIGSQYFIIPNVSDQNGNVDHEYSVVQTDSLPVILQNFDNSQLQLQHQDQLIFITNSSDQVECSETEVTSA